MGTREPSALRRRRRQIHKKDDGSRRTNRKVQTLRTRAEGEGEARNRLGLTGTLQQVSTWNPCVGLSHSFSRGKSTRRTLITWNTVLYCNVRNQSQSIHYEFCKRCSSRCRRRCQLAEIVARRRRGIGPALRLSSRSVARLVESTRPPPPTRVESARVRLHLFAEETLSRALRDRHDARGCGRRPDERASTSTSTSTPHRVSDSTCDSDTTRHKTRGQTRTNTRSDRRERRRTHRRPRRSRRRSRPGGRWSTCPRTWRPTRCSRAPRTGP